ncbi:MAG: IPT/TIG domain-containing protein, partial [Pirellulales bacterium]
QTTPAPPMITSFSPLRQRAGAKIAVRGSHFDGVKKVRLIGDDGQQSEAKFTVASDDLLTVVTPPMREGVKLSAIVVQGPGGVTVTLPRDLNVVKGGSVAYDRFQQGGKFCFAVEPATWFDGVESSLVYVRNDARASTRGRGNVVLFLKDGASTHAADASGIVIYHEPFARIQRRAVAKGDHKYIPVPAIRPSFTESLLEYEE